MKINKELLVGLVCDYEQSDRFKVVLNEISGRSRWSVHYACVIQDTESGKFYNADYSHGATESQYESPFEYDEADENGDLELTMEVEPYEVTVTKYRMKK